MPRIILIAWLLWCSDVHAAPFRQLLRDIRRVDHAVIVAVGEFKTFHVQHLLSIHRAAERVSANKGLIYVMPDGLEMHELAARCNVVHRAIQPLWHVAVPRFFDYPRDGRPAPLHRLRDVAMRHSVSLVGLAEPGVSHEHEQLIHGLYGSWMDGWLFMEQP